MFVMIIDGFRCWKEFSRVFLCLLLIITDFEQSFKFRILTTKFFIRFIDEFVSFDVRQDKIFWFELRVGKKQFKKVQILSEILELVQNSEDYRSSL